MIIEYITKFRITDKESLKTLDLGAKGFQSMLVESARVLNPALMPLVWILTRFYKRTITDQSVKYDFYLIS